MSVLYGCCSYTLKRIADAETIEGRHGAAVDISKTTVFILIGVCSKKMIF
jgi:hypothetical protein